MIKLYNFDLYPDSGICYGGHSGSKKGILIAGEKWMLKFPKSTKSMDVSGLTYTTSPISEYLASHIYASVGIDTHETILGKYHDRIVVGCKDFLKSTEEILDFNAIKNNFEPTIEAYIAEKSSHDNDQSNDIDAIEMIMQNNHYFLENPEFIDLFWDMFIMDAFLANNDRNENNWGLIINKKTGNLRLTPVYDNGASFYDKSPDEKLINILNDEYKFKQMTYDSAISIFKQNNKDINPLKFIESRQNANCNKALVRIFPKIDMAKIKTIFAELPTYYNDFIVMSDIQKEVYYKTLEYKYEKVFKVVYEKLTR